MGGGARDPHRAAAMMSLTRMSAGSGYRYLLRSTATADAPRAVGESLTAYYAASGNPPGRWLGRGLGGVSAAGIEGAEKLVTGAVVTEDAMAALYGEGRHPGTREQLGRPYPKYLPPAQRVADAVAALPESLTEAARAAAVAAIEARVAANPSRRAVAGFDLTFTVPKSASVLWALGDERVQAAVLDAHREATVAVLGLIEDRFLFTRTGSGSTVRVSTAGLVAAAFDHFDSRAGDPNLHTHVVAANKVQGPDGVWRSVDAQVLFSAAVACSEVYDDLLADALAARLPVSWGHRDRGARRTPAFEIDGLGDDLLRAFSQRSRAIERAIAGTLATADGEDGRGPSRTAVIKARQQATLATRPDKRVRSLTELQALWHATARQVVGTPSEQIVQRALERRQGRLRPQRVHIDAVPTAVIEEYAVVVLAGLQERRSTWSRPNTLAEAARATRGIRMRSTGDRLALLDHVTTAALARCVPLDPAPPGIEAAHRVDVPRGVIARITERFRSADRPTGAEVELEPAYTTAEVLQAEADLLAATELLDAPAVSVQLVDVVVTAVPMPGAGRMLVDDQADAVRAVASSGRRVEALVGPAGSGKTRTLHALRAAWTLQHGNESVVGFAPSAAAAAELSAALGIRCDTLAKWRHDHAAHGGKAAAGLPGRLPAGGLVICDEASLAATADLHALVTAAAAAGAKVVLVGDHHQLGAVGAGGAFALLADRPRAVELRSLWRFAEPWEAHATQALRAGGELASALAAYSDHGRLHEGPAAEILERAYDAWAADLAAGRSSLLLAADRDTVAELNSRAQRERRAVGTAEADGVPIADGATAGRGDVIVTRRNDRRMQLPDGGHVRNGALWHVLATHPDGSVDARALPRPGEPVESSNERAVPVVRLPADYVRDHVELGYATTVHRAQGLTVDTSHTIVDVGMARQTFYVAMTRGRLANHAYSPNDQRDEANDPANRSVLETVLTRDGAELSATAVLRQRAAASPHGLRARLAARIGARPDQAVAAQHRPTPEQAPSIER
ncbi:MAG: MobF family relaxase [Sporichthyaceae bacterium]